jgi:hypothetical protein
VGMEFEKGRLEVCLWEKEETTECLRQRPQILSAIVGKPPYGLH